MATSAELNILSLLTQSALSSACIKFYPKGCNYPPLEVSYSELLDISSKKAAWLRQQDSFREGSITLIHFKSHLDNIIWFWASIIAGNVPALSPPLVNTSEGRHAHFQHLWRILENPLVLTSESLIRDDFVENDALFVIPVESSAEFDLDCATDPAKNRSGISHFNTNYTVESNTRSQLKGIATLALTSGSSGHSKAVCLGHEQIFASLRGKLTAAPIPENGCLLNWIGLDHVASLVEMHLLAMFTCVTQVQIQAVEVLSNPLGFLHLLSENKVSMTFAPDFFLARLLGTLDQIPPGDHCLKDIDLSHLQFLTSGGELNNVDTGFRVIEHLRQLGVKPANLIIPGFGMTEICAGGIFNKNFPAIDKKIMREFGVLGEPVPGLKMRISPLERGNTRALEENKDLERKSGLINEVGQLEVQGPIVFSRYLNDQEATKQSFTSDGWFQTGDLAKIDTQGQLYLEGRLKELININSVKYLPYEIEDAIEAARIPGVEPSFIACFSHRNLESPTSPEMIYVVYQQQYDWDDIKARFNALHAIVRTVVLVTSSRPQVLPLPAGCLQKTSLGKLSRPKIRSALVEGKWQEHEHVNEKELAAYRNENLTVPSNKTEEKLVTLFQEALGVDVEMDVDMPILDTGISSVELMRLKRVVELSFNIEELPMIIILTNTTIRSLAEAIHKLQGSQNVGEYKPVVTLQPNGEGSKVPLWLFHPGVGEILIFLGLAQHFPDRPVYAFRPRGFNPGEKPFHNQEDLLEAYYRGLKEKQPKGPYAMAGYSYGSVLAFELSKRLEAEGETVQFLASFNLPPHIKQRMRTLDWTAGLIHIAHFCDIISQERADKLNSELRSGEISHRDQIATVLAESEPERTARLGLTPQSLFTWVNVALSLQKIGWTYDPSGMVSRMDIFYCQPLKDVASSREEYRNDKLNHWTDFARDVKYHEVGGEHYTMIGPEHLPKFQQTLKRVMAARGL
ncbi:Thioesterase [Penicillium angulare]|uniref:Thioesterase n=1 Tax=Penicillium angulare TaxID=116970 RepID=UPI00253F97C2|nr:Thioesterase [Penicillium angulare]KAJ5263652.1 Thioesterase [Penicillium angulare]